MKAGGRAEGAWAEAAAAVAVVGAEVVVEALPPIQVILRFLHRAEHRPDSFTAI